MQATTMPGSQNWPRVKITIVTFSEIVFETCCGSFGGCVIKFTFLVEA